MQKENDTTGSPELKRWREPPVKCAGGQKAKNIIGLPVLTRDSGKKLQKVKDVLLDRDAKRVVALLLAGGTFGGDRMLPYEGVSAIGPDAVIIPDQHVIVEANSEARNLRSVKKGHALTDLEVYTDDGRRVGTIDDLLVDTRTGEVCAYEIAGGVVQKAMRGKRCLTADKAGFLGEQVAFVSSDAGTELEQQPSGGLQATAGVIGAKGASALDRTSESLSTGFKDVGRKTKEAGKSVAGKTREFSASQTKSYAVGKKAKSDVMAGDHIVVRQGQTVTPEQADEAERLGVLGGLAAAVGAAQAAGLGEQTRGALAELKRGFQDIAGGISGGVTEQARRTKEEKEEDSVRDALGRPVTRVILDKEDRVILNVGEIITHRAVERARQADVLDILLVSVYTGTPSISPEDMRAHERGEASVEARHRSHH